MVQIKNITINNTEFEPSTVNVVIGPNNTGKSTLIRELNDSIQNQYVATQSKWLSKITLSAEALRTRYQTLMPTVFSASNFAEVQEIGMFTKFYSPHFQSAGSLWDENAFRSIRGITDEPAVREIDMSLGTQDLNWYMWRMILGKAVLMENCASRLSVTLETNISKLGQRQNDIINFFYLNNEEFRPIYEDVKDVFGYKLGFDNMQHGWKPLRILPESPILGSSREAETFERWEKEAPTVAEQGDGIKAYLKLIFSLYDKSSDIVFIDEPEAFLHPPQRRALGALVAKLTKQQSKQIFIATHDPEFLRGILSANPKDVKIFKLSKNAYTRECVLVQPQSITSILSGQSSQLMNERILNSFFYRKTLICENEDDRVFYEEASARFFWKVFQEVSFIGVNGKDEVDKLTHSLKRLNINAAAIVDIDFILDRDLRSFGVDDVTRSGYLRMKNFLNTEISDGRLTKDELKARGRKVIQERYPGRLEEFDEILGQLDDHGLHIVQVGEYESFTQSSHKNLRHALAVIRAIRKVELTKFLKRILHY